MIEQWPSAIVNQTYEDKYLLEKIFAFKFSQYGRYYSPYTNYDTTSMFKSAEASSGARTVGRGVAAPLPMETVSADQPTPTEGETPSLTGTPPGAPE